MARTTLLPPTTPSQPFNNWRTRLSDLFTGGCGGFEVAHAVRQGKVLALRAAYGPTTQVQLVGTKRHAATATIDTGPAAKYGEKKYVKLRNCTGMMMMMMMMMIMKTSWLSVAALIAGYDAIDNFIHTTLFGNQYHSLFLIASPQQQQQQEEEEEQQQEEEEEWEQEQQQEEEEEEEEWEQEQQQEEEEEEEWEQEQEQEQEQEEEEEWEQEQQQEEEEEEWDQEQQQEEEEEEWEQEQEQEQEQEEEEEWEQEQQQEEEEEEEWEQEQQQEEEEEEWEQEQEQEEEAERVAAESQGALMSLGFLYSSDFVPPTNTVEPETGSTLEQEVNPNWKSWVWGYHLPLQHDTNSFVFGSTILKHFWPWPIHILLVSIMLHS